ncbi:MAG: hypothetical protein K1X89_07595 [Myxococcaceae bacterium]|nr:hypothetical protein [Myxococcaceae bacterium]
MRTFHLIALPAVLLSLGAEADQNLSPPVTPAEVGRFQVKELQGPDALSLLAKLDSMTGATWSVCKDNPRKWCRFEAPSTPLASGPVGRYALVSPTAGAKAGLLLDTVSGRAWQVCTPPTPSRALAWCPLEG